MSLENKIPNVSPTQKSISASLLNSVIDAANRSNSASVDPTSIHVQQNDGKSINNINVIENDDHPFKIGVYQDNLSITPGAWIRNQTSVTLEADSPESIDSPVDNQILVPIDYFSDNGTPSKNASTTYYVTVFLEQDTTINAYNGTALYDESLIPGKLVVRVDSDVDYVHKRSPEYFYSGSGTYRDFWIKDREIVGTVTLDNEGSNWWISSYKNTKSDDIIDLQIVPDSLSKDTTNASHSRQTITPNRYADDAFNGTIHFGETQLANVEKCPGEDSASFPFFGSFETNNTTVGPAGVLGWTSVDSFYRPQGSGTGIPKYKTLGLQLDYDTTNVPDEDDPGGWSTTNSFNVFTLYGVLNTLQDSYSMCYYDAGTTEIFQGIPQTQGELKWAVIDSHLDSFFAYNQESLETKAVAGLYGRKLFQLKDFDDASATAMDKDDDLVLFWQYNSGGPILRYADPTEFWDYISEAADDSGDLISEHYKLTDIVPGSYTKWDHANHWCNVDTTTGRVGVKDVSYLVNNGSSIGDSNRDKTIDLDNRILDNGDWQVDGNFTATGDKTKKCGTAAKRWLEMHTFQIDIYAPEGGARKGYIYGTNDDNLNIAATDDALNLSATSWVQSNKSFRPTLNDNYDLGDDGTPYRWRNLLLSGVVKVDGTQIVQEQGASVSDASITSSSVSVTGSGEDSVARGEINNLVTDVTDLKDQLNALLSRLRAHGLIAT